VTLNELRYIREKLRLSTRAFAAVFGVAPSSLYRWESTPTPAGELRMDPFRQQLFTVLRDRLRGSSEQELSQLAGDVEQAFARSGSLFALKVVLDFIYVDSGVV